MLVACSCVPWSKSHCLCPKPQPCKSPSEIHCFIILITTGRLNLSCLQGTCPGNCIWITNTENQLLSHPHIITICIFCFRGQYLQYFISIKSAKRRISIRQQRNPKNNFWPYLSIVSFLIWPLLLYFSGVTFLANCRTLSFTSFWSIKATEGCV